jgi:hypothetical protein
MARFRCNTCQGEYEDVLPDRTMYFHSCPLQTRYRVRLVDNSVVVTDGPLPVGATLLGEVHQERRDARNENITGREGETPGEPKAQGKGRTPVADNER